MSFEISSLITYDVSFKSSFVPLATVIQPSPPRPISSRRSLSYIFSSLFLLGGIYPRQTYPQASQPMPPTRTIPTTKFNTKNIENEMAYPTSRPGSSKPGSNTPISSSSNSSLILRKQLMGDYLFLFPSSIIPRPRPLRGSLERDGHPDRKEEIGDGRPMEIEVESR